MKRLLVFSGPVAVGSKGYMWDIASTVWAIETTVWDVIGAICAIIVSVWAVAAYVHAVTAIMCDATSRPRHNHSAAYKNVKKHRVSVPLP